MTYKLKREEIVSMNAEVGLRTYVESKRDLCRRLTAWRKVVCAVSVNELLEISMYDVPSEKDPMLTLCWFPYYWTLMYDL